MPQTTEDILRIIEESNADVLSEMLNNLIKEHRREKGDREQTLYKRYIQDKDAVPILTRRKANPMKINEKLGNDFFGDIVDTKTGYMGNEISVELKKDNYYKEEPDEETGEPHDVLNENDYDVDTQKLKDFSIRNDTEDTNSEAIKLAAICGWCPRLLYIKLGDTEPRLMNLNPWEVIVVYDSSIHEPEAFAITRWKKYPMSGRRLSMRKNAS
jgi:hypothetical protein